jgi:hypothetical protein
VGAEQLPDRAQETGRVIALVKSTIIKLESVSIDVSANQETSGPGAGLLDPASSTSSSGLQVPGGQGVWDVQDHLADFSNDSLWDRYLKQYLELEDIVLPVDS